MNNLSVNEKNVNEEVITVENQDKTNPGTLSAYQKAETTERDTTKSIDDSSIIQAQKLEVSFRGFSTAKQKLKILVYGNDVEIKSPLRIGNVYSFLYIENFPILIIGPNYIKSLLIYFFYFIFNLILSYFAIERLHFVLIFFTLLVFFVHNLVYLFVLIINPGIPNKNNYITDEVINIISMNVQQNKNMLDVYRKCDVCNILVKKKNNVEHCADCNICVEGIN